MILIVVIRVIYLFRLTTMQAKIKNSLEPTQRELVLMRRDLERQHQEQMQMECQYEKLLTEFKEEQKKNMKMQEDILSVIKDEQIKTRKAQEKTLTIEEEREWRNKYK